MTRFARAKGSKACNQKAPEEATSWAEMKKGIISKSTVLVCTPKEPEANKKENIKTKAEWAQLDTDTVEEHFSLIREHHKKKVKTADLDSTCDSKKKESKGLHIPSVDNNVSVESTIVGKKKVKEPCLGSDGKLKQTQIKRKRSGEQSTKPTKKMKKVENCSIDKAVEKKKLKKKNKGNEEDSNALFCDTNLKTGTDKHENNIMNKNRQGRQKKLKNAISDKNKKENLKVFNKTNLYSKQKCDRFNNTNNYKNHEGLNKKNGKNSNRHDTVEELIVNGEKIQIVKFQGFNVTLDDAERLKKLRNDMFKEGIPRDKLEAAIKLERRRAEKSLSRLKKAVCFHCRGFGHVLSQCPTLSESQNTGTGICYKCGSTEHSSAECKVVRGASFQFAECFICKEQGHIARQCPDNPRGLYPHGGACKECGDVTHLRKDCPKAAIKKEDVVTVGVRNDRNLESLDDKQVDLKNKINANSRKKKSIVKF